MNTMYPSHYDIKKKIKLLVMTDRHTASQNQHL
jgi:hypothetical protein